MSDRGRHRDGCKKAQIFFFTYLDDFIRLGNVLADVDHLRAGKERDRVEICNRCFLFFSLQPAFLTLVLQLHIWADRLPMIRARQPSGLDY